MSGSYTFLPWSRQGLANRITGAGPLRVTVPVQLELSVHHIDGADVARDLPARDVQLYGPGDVIGLDTRGVIRTEPRDGTANCEPNYLAAIEFADEDLPWRYTPALPDVTGRRLSPWIVLIVLKESVEFDEGRNVRDRPLPFITLKNAVRQTAFPEWDTVWAWAHVHVNRGLTSDDTEIVSVDRDVVAERLAATLADDADLAYSRIVCPRRLRPKTTYHAFVIPAFESGRLAGLGLDPGQAPSATASAWSGEGTEPDTFPIYFRWRFHTGAIGDFEYLVRLLQPRAVDGRVGVRDMDVQRPGSNVPGLTDPDLHGVLALGGALRVPRASLSDQEQAVVEQQENWAQPHPHPFQRELAALINLGDDYTTQNAAQANAASGVPGVVGDLDPVIAPPLYGRWHAMTRRVLVDRSGNELPATTNWVHELNLDPRFRVPAGFGTKVVQSKQEDLMAAAWEQVGEILEAHRRIRQLRFAQQACLAWYDRHLTTPARHRAVQTLLLTAPVHGRVMAGTGLDAATMKMRLARSVIPPALIEPAMRRAIRPRGRLAGRWSSRMRVRLDDLIARVNTGDLLPAPQKVKPAGVPTLDDIAEGMLPSAMPPWVIAQLRSAPWVVYAPVVVAFLLALVIAAAFGFVLAGVVVAVGIAATVTLVRAREAISRADASLEENQTPARVDRLMASPDFAFTRPRPDAATVTLTPAGPDSAEAARFKAALKDVYAVLHASKASDTIGENPAQRPPLDFAVETASVLQAIHPSVTIPRRANALVRLPPRIRAELPEVFVEPMAYPIFDMPMYRPLADLSADLLIPNIHLLEHNSVTLLETNQKFIEAYMVGLNHECGRELLWRGYPTDQRGSYFRQFWEASNARSGAGADGGTDADIPTLHEWSRRSPLGAHDARERQGNREEEVVLVIRAELLKRYPNAVIYAQAAKWTRLDNGEIDRRKERTLVEVAPSEQEEPPPREKVRTPLYSAKIEPDIYFLGFDLTVPAARGGAGDSRDDPAGWFFVIKERPGEPRYGFDEASASPIVVWNDLGWDRVPMTGETIRPVPGVAPDVLIPALTPAGQEEKEAQRADDEQVRWDNDVSAAELAYVLYQAPAMVAIHASEMLPLD